MRRPKIIYERRAGGPAALPVAYPRETLVLNRRVVGWREWIGLPDFRIAMIQAKLDTGARSSALHACDIQVYEADGATWVRFHMADPSFGANSGTWHAAPVLGSRRIKSSSGSVEKRFVIRTRIEVAGSRWQVDVGLTDRSDMGVPMLIGRSAMHSRLLVDPDRSYLWRRPKLGALYRQ